ncbi:hypothetical protein QSV34_04595 [Porticoccus sp. W117]|uniref:hypothetical protein n=1 Tax=Porticoccus sp. W117 TaxID=3054777 RepID=UPI002598C6FA|nr:hypothetical protein [Porticoccus sp. W117]MDM3870624.1 hypothetical protein [Porticoccus sp. W117]
MKSQKTFLIPLICSFLCLVSCKADSTGAISKDHEATVNSVDSQPELDGGETSSNTPTLKIKRQSSIKNYLFGHSLINHVSPEAPAGNNETSVPHWLQKLAKAAGNKYYTAGQYGFLRNHAELPPKSQWGFSEVPTAWDPDLNGESFSDVGFTSVILTAANFIQYQSPNTPFDGDNPTRSTPLTSTLEIIDWISLHSPSSDIYIYENWPDMAQYISSFPPSKREFSRYHAKTLGEFHEWWIQYQDQIREARPQKQVKMLPVGPVIASVLQLDPLNTIPATELYEDDAPHGKPTIYFLAALVTYMGIYGEQSPDNLKIPSSIHPLVKEHYQNISQHIWNQLSLYTFKDGQSRVWFEEK